MPEVVYAKPAAHDNYGRNGGFQAHGLYAWSLSDTVFLRGISSRGDSSSAELVVPKSEIDNVIKMLESMK